jgi:thioredoxin 2
LPWLVETDAAGFEQETRSSVPVLVDFWAPWCGPCLVMAPVLEQLARERAGRLKVVKLDVDEAPALARRYQVQGIPLLVLLRDRDEVARLTGAVPQGRLTAWLDGRLAPTRH